MLVAASAFAATAGSAGASTFTVTNTSASGAGSLNQAIAAAAAHSGPDTITFAASTNHHTLPAPDTIASDVTLNGNGPGVTVIAGELDVNTGGSQKISTAFNGLTIGDFNINSGFGSSTTATISHVDVVHDGLNINSGFNNSHTAATLDHVRVSGGGGIDVNAGSSTTVVRITNSTVSGSSAEPLTANDGGSTVTVVGSTFAHNHDAIDAVGGATISLTNSTITGATEQGVRSDGHVNLQNVTITKNTGGAVAALSGTMNIGDSILADNAVGASAPECSVGNATFASHGGNLSDDASCHPVGGDHANTPPKLGSLGSNGGATQTFAPLAGSAAIDGGVAAGCPNVDQRGVARPQDGNGDHTSRCDSGAVEIAAKIVAKPTPTPTTVATTVPASTTPVTAAATPSTAPAAVAPAAQLPRTGAPTGLTALAGLVTLILGGALLAGHRRARTIER